MLNLRVLFRKENGFLETSFFKQGNVGNERSTDCRHEELKPHVTRTKKDMTLIKTKHTVGDWKRSIQFCNCYLKVLSLCARTGTIRVEIKFAPQCVGCQPPLRTSCFYTPVSYIPLNKSSPSLRKSVGESRLHRPRYLVFTPGNTTTEQERTAVKW